MFPSLFEDDFVLCVDEQNAALTSQLPKGNDTPLPPNPELEHMASGHVSHETEQNYDNGHAGHMEIPVKKQDSTVRKRPGVDNGDYTDIVDSDTNTDNMGDGLENLVATVAYDGDGVAVQPRAALYNSGFVNPQILYLYSLFIDA